MSNQHPLVISPVAITQLQLGDAIQALQPGDELDTPLLERVEILTSVVWDLVFYLQANKIGQHPVVLGANEGLILRLESLSLPVTNTIRIYPTIEWAEVPSY